VGKVPTVYMAPVKVLKQQQGQYMWSLVSLTPRPSRPAFVAYSTTWDKAGRRGLGM